MKRISINVREGEAWVVEEHLDELFIDLEDCGFTSGGSHCEIRLVPKSAWFFCKKESDEGFVFDVFPCEQCDVCERYKTYEVNVNFSERNVRYFGDFLNLSLRG